MIIFFIKMEDFCLNLMKNFELRLWPVRTLIRFDSYIFFVLFTFAGIKIIWKTWAKKKKKQATLEEEEKIDKNLLIKTCDMELYGKKIW